MRSELKLTGYSPNMRDPRVRRRVKTVLDFCDETLSYVESINIHSHTLRALFGNYSNGTKHRNELAIWLKANILREWPGTYIPGEQSRPYALNQEGYAKVKRLFEEATSGQHNAGRSRSRVGQAKHK